MLLLLTIECAYCNDQCQSARYFVRFFSSHNILYNCAMSKLWISLDIDLLIWPYHCEKQLNIIDTSCIFVLTFEFSINVRYMLKRTTPGAYVTYRLKLYITKSQFTDWSQVFMQTLNFCRGGCFLFNVFAFVTLIVCSYFFIDNVIIK